MIDRVLLERALKLLRSGEIPCSRPARIWGGTCFGETCRLCGIQLGYDEVSLEVQFGSAGPGANPHFHPRCWMAIEARAESLAGGMT